MGNNVDFKLKIIYDRRKTASDTGKGAVDYRKCAVWDGVSEDVFRF